MKEWAEREVELACKRENPDWDGESFNYGCFCYQSALKAYKSLSEDDHSGFSWGFTRNILMRLMNNQVLTSIEDTEDIWNPVGLTGDYQCTRMSSLFKTKHDDGTITYCDVDRAYGVIDGVDFTFCGSAVSKVVDALFPITMPYYPMTDKYRVLFHSDDDDYPYAIVKPNGDKVYVGHNCKGYYIIREDK